MTACLSLHIYIGATAPLARKQALAARLRLSCIPIRTNLVRGVPYVHACTPAAAWACLARSTTFCFTALHSFPE